MAKIRRARDRRTGEVHWLWTGALQRPQTPAESYGITRYPSGVNDPITAHRAFYIEFVGPVAAHEDVHHRCRVRLCCNPDHLAKLPAKLNRDGRRVARWEARHPHPFAVVGEGAGW